MALTGAEAKDVQFVGFDNYVKMFTDPNTWIAIKNTLIFLVGSLLGQSVLGFLIAYLMKNKAKAFRSVVGPCILVGWVMPEIVVSCPSAFFDMSGTMNTILGVAHIKPIEWIYSNPMLTITIANIWHGTAFSMMNFQSALDNVSGDIEEAARVDGATRIQTLVRTIVPCIKDTIATNTMLNTLSTLGVFGLILGADRRRTGNFNDYTANLYVQHGNEKLPVGTGNGDWYAAAVPRRYL